MTRLRKTIATGTGLGLLLTALIVQAQPSMGDHASAYRLGAFRMIGWHLGPLGAMAKGEMPFDAAKAADNAKAIATLATFPNNAFIDGSSSDDVKTRALPEIWLDREDFDEKMAAFEKAAAAMPAASGSLDTLKPALGELGGTCKSCHKKYRAKKK